MSVSGTANKTPNFSMRDIFKVKRPLSVMTPSSLRRRRGSRDLRTDERSPTESSSQRLSGLSNCTITDHNKALSCDDVSSTTPLQTYESHTSSSSSLKSPFDVRSTFSFSSDDEDEDDINDDYEGDADTTGTSYDSEISPRASIARARGEQEWPVTFNKDMFRSNNHKDSAIAMSPGEQFSRLETARPGSSGAVTTASEASSVANEPFTMPYWMVRQSRSRFSSVSSLPHEQQCVCDSCRQTRHKRRKSSLCLLDKLEECRHIMMTIRNPHDPSNHERGVAYGHWLKLARLYVKYETLLDTPIEDSAEDEQPLREYVHSYSSLVELIHDEAKKWPHLFEGRVDAATVIAKPARGARVVDVDPPAAAVNRSARASRHQSLTLKMLESQGPLGNCRAVGSNFF